MNDLLTRYGLKADKSFGQNFLVDEAALRAVLAAAELSPGDRVLEVGPGLGTLTFELAVRGARVTAVELDRRLLPLLEETLTPLRDLEGAGSVEVVHGDGVKFDFQAFPAGAKLVANLPYNVATPIISRALESGRFSRLVVLVQREVGERLSAAAGTPAYGALSLLVAHYGTARIVRTVPPGAFMPPPKVTSAVVRIDTHAGALPDPELFRLIHHGFAHRRKTLRKNLEYAGYERNTVEAALKELGLDGAIRAEAVDLETFRALRLLLPVVREVPEEG